MSTCWTRIGEFRDLPDATDLVADLLRSGVEALCRPTRSGSFAIECDIRDEPAQDSLIAHDRDGNEIGVWHFRAGYPPVVTETPTPKQERKS